MKDKPSDALKAMVLKLSPVIAPYVPFLQGKSINEYAQEFLEAAGVPEFLQHKEEAERERDEWRTQHENLVEVRQQDVAALTTARDHWIELCRRALAYLPSTLGITKQIRAEIPPYDETKEPVFGEVKP